MRLLRTGIAGDEKPCAVDARGVVRDVSALVRDWSDDALHPDVIRDVAARLSLDATALPAVDLSTTRIGPPVRPGGHLMSIGLNYRSHAADAGMEVPAEPIVSTKAPSTMVGPGDDLIIPPQSTKTDWEVELAIVIGRRAQYLASPRLAMQYVSGFCTANDISERTWLLERGGQWIKGKSFESFTPLGPFLVTPDEVGDPQALRLTCHVNGRLMQDATTADMIFDVPYLVWYLTQFLVLNAGDVILTGSPGGFALGRPDKPYLRPGDAVVAEVAGLGPQRQTCRAAQVSLFDGFDQRFEVNREHFVERTS